jgi:hypothetical protein
MRFMKKRRRFFMRTLFAALLFTLTWPVSVLATEEPMHVYRSSESFALLKENLEMAITNRGLIISNTLHISELLNRTGADFGVTTPVYSHAEALEFCSAGLSHKMTQAHPLNLSICPFTISLYILPDEPDQVYAAFRKISLAGDEQGTLTTEIETFLHSLVREALELD